MKVFCLHGFVILFFAACTTQKPTIENYLQNSRDTLGKGTVNIAPPVVQKGDVLSIKVFSKANGMTAADRLSADAPYNLQDQVAGGSTTTSGFMVDVEGNIEYPQLGKLHIEGLTREQVGELIKSRLQDQLDQPSVIVRFQNFKISVLGEVNSPGSFTLPTERVTILEALGLSGDITEYGRKTNVMVVRETNGEIQRGTIDLTSNDMFSSPYYRLQQNDVVFVESNGRRVREQQRTETAQQIGLGISIITAIALILNFIR